MRHFEDFWRLGLWIFEIKIQNGHEFWVFYACLVFKLAHPYGTDERMDERARLVNPYAAIYNIHLKTCTCSSLICIVKKTIIVNFCLKAKCINLLSLLLGWVWFSYRGWNAACTFSSVFQPFCCSGTLHKCDNHSSNPVQWSVNQTTQA